ncbi:ABC transporter permease [Lactiplantibacillus dongliensis]|uniref:ABC transporter permease n=1 Tax=Lactiplantibacillus dongliensis TaxID=2559919 RepID=A0ABW1R5D4_9LACO|nr:ABC transporter permease [Lactiplantibacillus dongliensis]
MGQLLQQEIFKFRHQRLAWLAPVILVLLQAGLAMTAHGVSVSDQKFYVSSAYGGFQWLTILIIVIGASCVTMEFEYGTIKQLAIQVNHRWTIFVGKYVLVLGYSVLLHGVVILMTLLLKGSSGRNCSWQNIYLYHQSLLTNLVTNAALDMYGGVMIVGLVFLLASCSHNSAAAIAIGVGVCFVGEGVSSLLLQSFKSLLPVMKWNPFNMFFLQEEYGNPSYQQNVTHLTIQQLGVGNLVWALFFVGVGAVIFSRRRI